MKMNPNRSSNKQGKSALGNLLNEKSQKIPTLVSPVLQQVGKLAVGVASVSTELLSSGSATGNPRNKCSLQPGHSLMDWIRLGSSGKDLTGVGAQAGHMSVTKLELSRHNRVNDLWLAIRGKVYNVTEYVPFHPGGPKELMRAAGIDATRLFDQIHPWVNYDQILQKCFIGRLVSMEAGLKKEALFLATTQNSSSIEPDENNLVDKPKPFDKDDSVTQKESLASKVESPQSNILDSQLEQTPIIPRFDWIQRIDYVTVIFYTRPFSNPMVEILPPTPEKAIIFSFSYDETVFRNEIVFYDNIIWPCSTKVTIETGKIEFAFQKSEGRIWENYGVLRQQSKSIGAMNGSKYNFTYNNKVQVTHNIFLIKLERTDGGKIIVPVGKHVRTFANIDGLECSRSYTPVPESLFSELAVHGPTTDSVCLMIKRYENGNVSKYLTSREKNDVVYLTKPLGDFELRKMEKRELFLMLAAGTGITPMLSLLVSLLERRIKKCQFIRLLFFNKTERDIPFKEQLDHLARNYMKLRINYVLSEPEENWTGLNGHVNNELIDNSIQEHIKDTGYTIKNVFTFVCGPSQFVTLSLQELQVLDISDEQIHVFQG